MLTPQEANYFYPLVAILLGILVINYFKKDYLAIWSPLSFVAIIFIYYAVVGPYIAIKTGATWYRLIDHREFYENGWKISLVGVTSIIIGFNIVRKKNSNKINFSLKSAYLKNAGKYLLITGVLGFILVKGTGGFASSLNFLEGGGGGGAGYGGAFRNYFAYMINFFIPGLCFLLITLIRKDFSIYVFFIFLFIAIALYTNAGFRYRHVLLIMSLIMVYFFQKQKKPNIALFAPILVLAIIAMGIIGSTRQYGRGLSLDKIEGATGEELFYEGFSEAAIFQTTGFLMEMIPEFVEPIGWAPVTESLAMPIPRQLWPGKPSGSYVDDFTGIYGENIGKGAAILNIGEYYLAGGMGAVIFGCIIIGFLYKKLWLWFKVNRHHPLAQVIYAVTVSYIYVIISRGYLPQVTMLYFFTAFPAYAIYRYVNNNQAKLKKYLIFEKKD